MSAAPISGMMEKAETRFGFTMSVERIKETPRTTKPYTDAQWQAILARGRAVDSALTRADVRLTMGGEPTFIAADDMDAPEWTTDALGPTKRAYAGRLMRRLMARWSDGAVLSHGMGKQYPGEPLPRWTLHCHWRSDGEKVWTDPGLLASDDDTDDATAGEAARFAHNLAERLQIDPALVISAHEDAHYYLWKEQRLPANVLAEDSRLADPPGTRQAGARCLPRGWATPWAACCRCAGLWTAGCRRWQSGKWFFKRRRVDVPGARRQPGRSAPAVGSRCPGSIPTTAEYEQEPGSVRAATASCRPRQALVHQSARVRQVAASIDERSGRGRRRSNGYRPLAIRTWSARPWRSRRATVCCISSSRRCSRSRDWLALVAADRAAPPVRLGRTVVLERLPAARGQPVAAFLGNPRPGRHRGQRPSHQQLGTTRSASPRNCTRRLRQVGLATEKFNLDGRHVGTGGGNHVVMGAAVRRRIRRSCGGPDLLKSVVGFWHNHPSLSFLFSGQFIGPTSQHPRVDEARQDSLAGTGNRVFPDQAAAEAGAPLGHRPGVPQYPGGHDRQYSPHRVLHRQNVLDPDERRGQARPGGVPLFRDAAARADVGGADAADALCRWRPSGRVRTSAS